MSSLLFFFLGGIALGILFPKSRIVTIYDAIIMWLIVGWQYNTADYYNYKQIYFKNAANISLTFFGQPLFYLINVVVKKCFNEFQMMYVLCGLLAIVLVIIGVFRYTKRVNLVLSMFMISCFLLYAIQIRNFVSMSIVLLALQYLMPEKKSTIKYVILVIIATGFHVTSLFYLILLFIPYLNKYRLAILTTIICIGAVFSRNIFSNTLRALNMIDYTTSKNDMRTILIYNFFAIVILLITFYTCAYQKHNLNMYSELNENKRISIASLSNVTSQIVALMLVCIPLHFITIESVRLCRNLFLFFFCTITRLRPESYRVNLHAVKLVEIISAIMMICVLIFCFFYGDLYIYRQCYETVYTALFEYNLLFR